jgi:type II secretory pathway predicted ATPase ExeA
MYLSHYHLEKEPFKNGPDPSFLWRGGKHGEAIAAFREGILGRDGCVLLTGDIGTGKTTLLRHFIEQENVAAILLSLPDADLNVLDFYGRLADEFEMGRGADSRAGFIARLQRLLQDSFAIYRKVLIVIEDAQQLNPAVLAEAAALCDLKSAGRKRLKTIFVAPLEFDEILRREENRGVLAAITTHCRLEPLAEEETAPFPARACYEQARSWVEARRVTARSDGAGLCPKTPQRSKAKGDKHGGRFDEHVRSTPSRGVTAGGIALRRVCVSGPWGERRLSRGGPLR